MGLHPEPVGGSRQGSGRTGGTRYHEVAARRSGAAVAEIAPMADVDIVWFPLDRPSPDDERLLSCDELARADRFRFARERHRYITGRAQLRRLLSDRCGTPAALLEFTLGAQGKPALVGQPDVDFNISHGDGTALLALSTGCTVGIDIEPENPGIARSGIAEHFFAPGEIDHLSSVPEEDQDHAFLECWTRKEAYLKGKGGGLSLPLDGFEVSFGPGLPARLIRADTDPSDCMSWTLVDLTPNVPGGFVAALAVHAPVGGFNLNIISQGLGGDT